MRWPWKRRESKPSGTFVMDVEFHRTEELRPDRLGPAQDDVEDPVPVDPWRPTRTLGPIRWPGHN